MLSVKLKNAALRDNNNLDLVRLILASMVIYGHSFAVNPSVGMGTDLFFEVTGYHSGDLAIKGFFLISGILVTGSILSHKSVFSYVSSRFFRIWPALFIVVLITALVIGPMVTNMTLEQYFSDRGLTNYIWKTITLQNWGGQSVGDYDLPGVFHGNAYPKIVNAPLWSITAEVFAYILILFLFLGRALQKPAALVIFTLIAVDSLLPEKFLFYWLPQSLRDFSALLFCFAFGSIMTIYKKNIVISASVFVSLFALNYLIGGKNTEPLMAYMMLFVVIILFACNRFVRSVRIPYDISYGVFLYGWPIQQIIALYLPDWPHLASLLLSFLLAFIAGFFSCVLVERPSQKFGRWMKGQLLLHSAKVIPARQSSINTLNGDRGSSTSNSSVS